MEKQQFEDPNEPNKAWWDKNPMSYVEWGESARGPQTKADYQNINDRYLETNPFLREFFKNSDSRSFLINKKVLDIGAGYGTSALLLSALGAKVVAIDISDSAISGARRNVELFGVGANINLIRMDAEKLNFPNECFDFVYSWGVIHHSRCPESIIDETSRVLKHGGRGLFMVYNRHSIRYFCLGLWYLFGKYKIFSGNNLESVQKYFTDGYWHRHYSRTELCEMLEKHKLHVDNVIISYMARRIIPGLIQDSWLDQWLKKRYGWLLIVQFSKK